MRYCIFALITILLIFNVSVIYGQETADLENQVAKYEKEGNLLELARCQAKLGYLYKEKNNIQKSIEFFQKAVKTNESLGNMNAVKNLCVNIGLMYTELDNYDQALTFFKRSL